MCDVWARKFVRLWIWDAVIESNSWRVFCFVSEKQFPMRIARGCWLEAEMKLYQGMIKYAAMHQQFYYILPS